MDGLNFRVPMRVFLDHFLKDWCLASYLIINWDLQELVDLADRELPASFTKELATHVYGYLYEAKMPPAELQQVVLNVAEDVVAGRNVQLRAGDYIAAQQFLRGSKRQ
jgi:hypothetical protein